LSREEKKHRVLCLYQAELEQAEKKNREPLSVKDKDCLLPAHGGSSLQRHALFASILVFLVAVSISTSLSLAPADPRQDSLSDDSNLSAFVLGLAPPNISDRISSLRSQGHARLKISNCAEAEWWFATALSLLSSGSNLSQVYRGLLVGERGFALVCAQSFEAGAEQLEQHIVDVGFNQTLPHLANALGYAYYNMQEVGKAIDMFEAVSKTEPLNPIVWNNLASANMVEGNLTAAENALEHALYLVQHQPVLWHWYEEEMFRSMYHYQSRLENLTSDKPNVELWNGYPEAL
jgi:tetratricopeptide (TPR) repeat protein